MAAIRTKTSHAEPDKACLGCIVGVHGVRGLVTIAPYTQVAHDIVAYGPLHTITGRRVSLTLRGKKKAGLIASIAGVDSREAAEALKGVELFVDHGALPALPAGEWYHGDLIGLSARDAGGKNLGAVVAVQNFGAGDLLEVQPQVGDSFYVPLTRQAVPEIDMGAGHLTVANVEGLIEDTFQAKEEGPTHG